MIIPSNVEKAEGNDNRRLLKTYNLGYNILTFLKFYQIFLLLQVKRIEIISNKHGI